MSETTLPEKEQDSEQKLFRIAVLSGKGGVGKTSITAGIATALQKRNARFLAVDTDVDAPNLEILFRSKKSTPLFHFAVKTTQKASLIAEKCTGCKKCITDEYCYFDALSWDELQHRPIIDVVACEGCGACALFCPEKAFNIQDVDSGTINHLQTPYGFDVITGETILGAQTSGKMVSELRLYAEKIAKSQEIPLIILDGPPGIGCPVIAAVTGVQFVVVVVEPTKVALHDAERLIQVISGFKIPFGLVLNKSDIYPEGRQLILDFIKEHSYDLLGEIPMDSDWPISIVKGLPINIYRPEGISARQIRLITEKILNLNKLNEVIL